MLKRITFILSALIFLTSIVVAGKIVQTYNFEVPELVETDGKTSISMDNCQLAGEPGEPALPAYGVKLLLPPGEAVVSVNIIPSERIVIAVGIQIDPIQVPVIIGNQPNAFTPPNPAIYNSDALFPQELSRNIQTQFMCGYSIGYLALYSIQYRPQTGEVSYYPSLTVEVNTAPSAQASTAHTQNYRGRLHDRLRLQGKVDNFDYAQNYGSIITGTDEPVVPYLVIATPELAGAFSPLVDYRETCGYQTEILYVNDIYSIYSGDDHPDKIRNCIIDYYQNYNTDYVLLAADDEFMPHRGLYASLAGETDPDIPGDIYFAGLDGTWDNDGDHLYGESGEGDLVAEVIVGRAAVDTYEEASNFVNKQLMYQTDPVGEELENALMVGEDLGWTIWGSDLKEEIRLGTGTTTGFPPNFRVYTLYDTPSWSFSAMGDLLPRLNLGPQLVNHMGHANVNYMMKFYTSQVNSGNMTNNGTNHNFYIVYSQGCYCGSFDNRTTGGSYTSDCITEQFSVISNGAVCMVTNSRYGWGDDASTNGPSQFYDRQFFDAIFGENIFKIGEVNQDSKEDNIPYLAYATLWVYYELNLFGDPMLDIWTDTPMTLNPTYSPSIIIGSNEYTVEIPGLEGAYCALSNQYGVLGSAYTNASGIATIEFEQPVATVDPLTLGITAHNYLPFNATIQVITPNMPYIIVDQTYFNDNTVGDGDSLLDLGETSYIGTIFHNVGMVEATGVTAEFSCEDEDISVLNDFATIGSIAPGSTIEVPTAFELQVSSQVQDQQTFEATITMRDALDSTWYEDLVYEIHAPAVIISTVNILDNENMRLEPGDTADLEVNLTNTGSGEVREGDVTLMTDNPYITFNNANSMVSLIPSGATVVPSPLFNVTLSSDCPENSFITFYLILNDALGYSISLLFETFAGGFYDNMENGQGEWTHSACQVGFVDEWQMCTYHNHTPNGTTSWHSGDPNGGNYQNSSNGGLITPWMEMDEDAILTFWHWMDAETSGTYQGQCYDGGFVEITYNDVLFLQIYPESGYNFITRLGSSPTPFQANIQIFSGRFDWKQDMFDLSQYPLGDVKFRFQFGSDAGVVREGWYIDDVEFVYSGSNNPPTNFQATLENTTVHLSWNSPGVGPLSTKNPARLDQSLLSYKIYRNSTVLADNIQTLEYFDCLWGLPAGQYSYQISAVYSDGESALTPPQVIDYSGMNISNNSNLVPDKYFLEQNYPNPFNPQTTFRFGLPVNCKVCLIIYNIAGQEVTRLIDGDKPAGYYNMTWKVENLPSGIYLYKLTAGEFIETGKMLLLK